MTRILRAFFAPVLGVALLASPAMLSQDGAGLKDAASAASPGASAAVKAPADLKSGPFPPDIQRVKDRGVLRVAQYSGERSMFFMWLGNDTKVPENFTLDYGGRRIGGIDIGLARFLAERLGVKLELKRDCKTFSDVVMEVATGGADIGVSKLCPTFERLQMVRFSKPYASFSVSLLANREYLIRHDIFLNAKATYDDYGVFNKPEIRIAVLMNSSAEDLARIMFSKATIVPCERYEDAVLSARDGKVEMALGDDFEFLFITLLDPEINVYCSLLRPPDSPYNICMIVNSESPTLQSMADEACNYIKVYDAQTMIKKYGRILKNIKSNAMKNSGGDPSERLYPFDSGALVKKARSIGFGGSDAIVSLVVGAALLALLSIWVRMSRPRKAAGNA